ncbi:Papilin [Gryllus bimaculatus]|nr:Papilin [Gryllus bimaculatus]
MLGGAGWAAAAGLGWAGLSWEGLVLDVKLFGARHGPTSKNMFRVFNLYLEPKWDESGSQHVGNLTLSSDSLITFGECANSVRQTSGRLKDSVEVLWRAPPRPASSCVIFEAESSVYVIRCMIIFRATVVEDTSKWYMDDEFLSLTICEEERMVYNRQPEVQDPCCACDEAKYELTFEGLWSRHSHPKDFPKSWDTRFSDVIGASHAANYSFWKYLQAASPGLRQVAENDPSPDWFVGISGLELCLKNCSWIENVKFDLYPWDAGTNDGITYYSKGQETRNELIRQITSSFPNSKDSPFFDPTGAEMKPIARIYLTRQRLYEKFSCDSHDNKNIDCATTPFTTLGPCSVTCGRGVRLQQREYLDPKKANDAFCNETLTRRFICDKSPCPPPWSNEGLLDPKCETTEWTEWSPCPVCGGVQARDRKYKHEEYFKYCSSLNHHPVLQETLHCDPDPYVTGCSEEPPEDIPKHCEVTHWSDWSPCSVTCGNGTRIRSRLLVARDFHTRQIEIMNKRHDDGMDLMDGENSNDEIEMLAAASDHADCSKYKISQEMQCTNIHEDCNISPEDAREICQLPKDEGPCRFQSEHWYFDVEVGRCKQFNYGGCRGNRNNFASQEICEEVCSSVIVTSYVMRVAWVPCMLLMYEEELLANRTARLQEYGVSLSGVLSYNVLLREDGKPMDPNCEDTDTTNNGFRSIPSFSLTQVSTDDVSEETTTQPERDRSNNERPINCRVSRWGPWTACSVTCGEGYKHKYRKIEVHPTKNGKPCPKLRKKHKCQKPQCDDFANQMQSDENPTWGEAHWIKSIPGVDCVLSAWSPWSSCTKSCGSDRRRLRTRDILVHPTSGGMPCDRRIEYIYCAPIPCASNHPTD